eukprot:NODE_2406_length_1592_cov_49.918312_g2070_i0.p1 GENE.NODE_2406_length_1592_cov_49.918312_g2070_i0~~NODE_2406_length_1592_cov_49.918312_g2070_i0.p1  ORF type:complete len:466 (-),score=71.80 NODE_2406_length_1592_cov_49.918312_g2070_i0:140-1537(-)
MDEIATMFGFGDPPNVTVSHDSFCERMNRALCGVCCGLILIPVFCGILIWNEGRAVKTDKTLQEGKSSVVNAKCQEFNPNNNDKLVHIACDLSNNTKVWDNDFEIGGPYCCMQRIAEMYQWRQLSTSTTTKNSVGGGQTTTTCYYHINEWLTSYVNTASFATSNRCSPSNCGAQPVSCSNPSFTVTGRTFFANPIMAGEYKVPVDLMQNLPLSNSITAPSVKYNGQDIAMKFTYAYLQKQVDNADSIGDIRVSWKYSPASSVSILAKQTSDRSFTKWESKYGSSYSIYKFSLGIKTSDEMFEELEKQNVVLTWVLRFISFFVIWCGLQMVTGPIALIPELIPCVGGFISNVVGSILCYLNCIVASGLALFFIAIGWLAYRPAIGIPIFIVGVLLCCVAGGGLAYAIINRPPRNPPVVDSPQDWNNNSSMGSMQYQQPQPYGYDPPTDHNDIVLQPYYDDGYPQKY